MHRRELLSLLLLSAAGCRSAKPLPGAGSQPLARALPLPPPARPAPSPVPAAASAPAPPVPAAPPIHGPADYAQHIEALRESLPEGFVVLVEEPFVVIGDGGAEKVRRAAEGTVRWAVTMLKRAYFARDPKKILNVWLFKDKRSYEGHNVRLFGYKPSTPYGYYSSSQGALVMNIATGGGTLVHEIVHPFMEANFPECPAWINEGLGSLYEQSAERHGEIVGLTNWRLAGLQEALKRGPIPTFRQLSATSDDAFYNQDRGTNYAQARYLMYYLQEGGLVRRFYHQAHAGRAADPTGYEALVDVLGRPDMARFEKEWAAYVLTLRFG